jgi:hypothetical protein
MAIIMLGSSYASNQHSTREREREREIKLLSQTHSTKVDYSLFIMLAVLELEKSSGMAPAVFPPPIFVGAASVLWFRVSPLSPHEKASRSLYIGVFRSTHQFENKMDGIRATTAKQALVAQLELGPMPPRLFDPHWPTHVLLLLIFLPKENCYAGKILAPFEFRKVRETCVSCSAKL